MNGSGFYDPSGKIEHGGSVPCTVLQKQPGGYLIEFGRNGMTGLLVTRHHLKPQSRLSVQFDGFQSGMAVFHFVSPQVEEDFSPDEDSREQQRQSCRYAPDQGRSGRHAQQGQSGGYAQQRESGGYPQSPRSGAYRQRKETGVYRRPRPPALTASSSQPPSNYSNSRSNDIDQESDFDHSSHDRQAPQMPPRSRIVDHRPDSEPSLVQSFLSSLKQALWPIMQS